MAMPVAPSTESRPPLSQEARDRAAVPFEGLLSSLPCPTSNISAAFQEGLPPSRTRPSPPAFRAHLATTQMLFCRPGVGVPEDCSILGKHFHSAKPGFHRGRDAGEKAPATLAAPLAERAKRAPSILLGRGWPGVTVVPVSSAGGGRKAPLLCSP